MSSSTQNSELFFFDAGHVNKIVWWALTLIGRL
jgi:hypothetical protein